jgi:hypothetical protein
MVSSPDQIEMTVRQIDEGDTEYSDYVPDPEDENPHRFKWESFEVLLSSYMEMIEQKRIAALPHTPEYWDDEDPAAYHKVERPWYLTEDDETVVNITISAWNDLLSSI